MKHRTTDPACVRHRPPTGWWSRWRFERARGRPCKVCTGRLPTMPSPTGVGRYDPDAPIVLDHPGDASARWRDHIGEWPEP